MTSTTQRRYPRDAYRLHLKLFLLPFLIGSLVLVVLPAVATMAVAFTEYNSIGVPSWVGLENFTRLFRSDYVRISLYNTAIFVALAVPLRLAGAMGLALLLHQKGRLYGWYRAAVYLPTVVPEVAYALIWLWIFNPLYGPLNLALSGMGFNPPAWLAEPVTARLAIVILLSFQIGEGFVVLLAGLQTIPKSFYESARVDGASGWQTFTRITLPLLAPWLLLLTFRDLILSLQNTFTPSFVLTYGGPYYATTFAPLLIYEIAFDFFDFGLAAALLLLIYLVMAIIVLTVLNLIQARTEFDA
jgi:multiple sugar transport system permease protein